MKPGTQPDPESAKRARWWRRRRRFLRRREREQDDQSIGIIAFVMPTFLVAAAGWALILTAARGVGQWVDQFASRWRRVRRLRRATRP